MKLFVLSIVIAAIGECASADRIVTNLAEWDPLVRRLGDLTEWEEVQDMCSKLKKKSCKKNRSCKYRSRHCINKEKSPPTQSPTRSPITNDHFNSEASFCNRANKRQCRWKAYRSRCLYDKQTRTCKSRIITSAPTGPTSAPTLAPTRSPTEPTPQPTEAPSKSPTVSPTDLPTSNPSRAPTNAPTVPTVTPTSAPTTTYQLYLSEGVYCQRFRRKKKQCKAAVHTEGENVGERRCKWQRSSCVQRMRAPETTRPTKAPTSEFFKIDKKCSKLEKRNKCNNKKSCAWSSEQNKCISKARKYKSTSIPTTSPTIPTKAPSSSPTFSPTLSPSSNPTISPTVNPTRSPTMSPTVSPTTHPTSSPTAPTNNPTNSPTASPTTNPTKSPTSSPTAPTGAPTVSRRLLR